MLIFIGIYYLNGLDPIAYLKQFYLKPEDIKETNMFVKIYLIKN